MQKKLTDLFPAKKTTFSFELFPPRTDQGYQNLLATLEKLAGLKPDFISCTYGAGGGSRDRTFDIVQHIQKDLGIPGIAHLTCICHTKENIRSLLEDLRRRDIHNILALRGDPPQDQPDWVPGPEYFRYSCELCAFTRQHFGDFFSVGVAGFPEGHILCPDLELDARYLKMKIDNGADYVITQLFFNNADYVSYVRRLRALGIKARVIPGILPITDYDNLIKFCAKCGTSVTPEVHDIFKPLRENKEKTLEEGIRFTVRQCRDLLSQGAPGLHFYALNRFHPVNEIIDEVRK